MNAEIERYPDYLYVRVTGKYQGEFPEKFHSTNLARICQDGLYSRMLVDIRELLGRPDTMKRFEIATEHVKAFQTGNMRVAVVDDPKRAEQVSFFETVAINWGANLKVFTDFDAATEWLMK